MPEWVDQKTDGPKSDLEKYATEEFKLLGVSTGPDRLRALIQAPNQKTYFVAEKTKIGIHKGVIKKITPEVVEVREKIINVLGQEETVSAEIRLPNTSTISSQDATVSSEKKPEMKVQPSWMTGGASF